MIFALSLGITIVPNQPGHGVANKHSVEKNHTTAKAACSPCVLSNFESLSSAISKGRQVRISARQLRPNRDCDSQRPIEFVRAE
jgi:hypothetical protein